MLTSQLDLNIAATDTVAEPGTNRAMALHVRHAPCSVGPGPGVRGSLRKSSARDQGPAAGEGKIQRDCNLWMSSSVFFGNAVSKTSGAPAERAQLPVGERRRGGTSAPVCLFGGLFGGNRKASSAVPPPPEFKYHDDVPLPFPTSLISNTFLAGAPSVLPFPSGDE